MKTSWATLLAASFPISHAENRVAMIVARPVGHAASRGVMMIACWQTSFSRVGNAPRVTCFIRGRLALGIAGHKRMVHGYHVVFGTYGFWLPNDQRGAWSNFVAAWQLRLQGSTTRGIENPNLNDQQRQWQQATKRKLKYPEVVLDGQQALAVSRGFKRAIEKSDLTVWACSILPQYVHLIIARHRFKVEYIAGLMKGDATKALNAANLHPLVDHKAKDRKPPTPWNVKSYCGFLETEPEIEDAMAYVIENPMKEGKKKQQWSFVTPFAGLDEGAVTYE